MRDELTALLSPCHKLAGMLFIFVAGVLPVLSLFNNRAIVPVCIVLAIFVIIAWGPVQFWLHLRSLSLWTKTLGVGFFLWAGASVFWAPDFLQSLTTFGKLIGTVIIGFALIGSASFLFDNVARRALWAAFFSTIIVSLLLLGDIYSGGLFSMNVLGKGIHAPYGAFWFKPAATILAIAMWPITLFLWRDQQRLLSILAFGLSIAVMNAISVNTGLIATIMGMVVAVCFLAMGSLRAWIAIGLLSTAFMATPVIVGAVLEPEEITSELSLVSPAQNSIAYRLHIWHFAANAFFEKPITGWGLNASRHLGSDVVVSDSVRGEIGEAIPLHPHNAVLQLFLELGIVGAVLALGLICRILLRLGHSDWPPADRIFAVGMFTAIVLFYAVSFSAWSSWWNTYLCYAVALFVVARRSRIEME